MFLDLGCARTIVVSSADMAKEIIKTNDIIFSNRPETMAANFLYYEKRREKEKRREREKVRHQILLGLKIGLECNK